MELIVLLFVGGTVLCVMLLAALFVGGSGQSEE